jgi:cytochrome c oxidase subunit 3
MASSVHEPVANGPSRESRVSSGNGGWRNLVPAEGNLRVVQDYASPPASTGIWVGIAAICMTFAAFTSALVVRKGSSLDWRHFALPSILYYNTILLLGSSVTLEIARRRVAAFMGGLKSHAAIPVRWLYLTLGLGLLFVAGQYVAWMQLSRQGVFLASNPSSSFFYVLSAVHALHVLGGLGGLSRIILKLKAAALRRSTLDATARYWHFMDILWIYLLIMLWTKF